ncbi:MAG: FAD-dependent oxidoreductase [Kordiimonadaceae bacterium]|nr:FAD-dependent oxidoreductase [Kordiimonadaceae bacterium]
MTDEKHLTADICIIGAGSGGLSVASGTAQLGLKTILIEKSEMGGDCLNTGCVPSKALIAAAKRAEEHRKSDIKGIKGHEPDIDYAAVKDHVLDTIKIIEPHDSQERFEGLGVHVIREHATFINSKTVQAGAFTIKAKKFVIATGSRAVIPPIKGLNPDRVLTNENLFELREKPDHLLIIGGGAIGLEMAQAHKRLGCKVSVFDMGNILPRDDQKNVAIARECLKKEGVALYENIQIERITHDDRDVTITMNDNGKTRDINGSHILVAAGRKPATDDLGLDAANIKHTPRGITIDTRLRTSNRHIFAIGDVSGGPQFTHVAGYHAGIIIRQVCFKIPAKINYDALPWVTYLDPEIAQVGLTEDKAKERYGDTIKIVESAFSDNDRAISARATTGQIRVITSKKGRILGASIIGPHAGELIGVWALAISSKLKISAITSMITPYPTLGEINKRAAGAWYTPALFSEKTRKIVAFLQKLPF